MSEQSNRHALLELCTKATLTGNNISVRMLEFLSSVKHQPHGFKNLAQDFLDICRILWAIEAGLTECFRAGQHFPEDMVRELYAKFRQTNADFVTLDNMMQEFLQYENAGMGGKLRKGWRMMFADKSIARMRESLSKSRDALRMSALVFQWSLGGTDTEGSSNTGYAGLAAALDRMAKGRTVAGPPRSRSYDDLNRKNGVRPANQRELPKVPSLPPQIEPLPLGIPDRISSASQSHSDLATKDLRDSRDSLEELCRQPSIRSSRARSTRSHNIEERSLHDGRSTQAAEDYVSVSASVRRRDMNRAQDIPDLPELLHSPVRPYAGSGPRYSSATTRTAASSDYGSGRTAQNKQGLRLEGNLHSRAPLVHDDNQSPPLTDADTLLDEMESLEVSGPIKAIRLKADPSQVPHWQPRNAGVPNTPNMRGALVSAIQHQKHKTVEQLLDRGVLPDTHPSELHALREAILNHDLESVRLLLCFGADPNSADTDGTTPLLAAVEAAFLDGMQLLLKYGADPNQCRADASAEDLPLKIAIAMHKADVVQLLLTYGAEVNITFSNGETPLITAVGGRNASRRLVEVLLEYGADPNAKSQAGKTALFEAITNGGRADMVTALLAHGANPNLPGPKHMLWPATAQPACLKVLLARGADTKKTPGVLELATSINNVEAVRTLIAAGVDVDARKDGVYTPLCTAIRDDRTELFEMILAAGANPNLSSAEYPCFKCVTHFRTKYYLPRLLEAGADISSPPGICETAVTSNNMEALRWLLADGRADPNARTPEGHTALTTAIRENKMEMIEALLDGGAEASVRGEGWPVCMAVKNPVVLKRLLRSLPNAGAYRGVLEMAVTADQLESVKLLLEAGVSVEDRNGGVFSPLTSAIRESNKPMVRFLLDEAGADVNSPGEHLPLVKALRRFCGKNDTEILELLLERNADPNLMYRGWNAFMQAVENGEPDVLKLLVDRTLARPGGIVDLNATDEAGRTVIEIATGRGWTEGAKILKQES